MTNFEKYLVSLGYKPYKYNYEKLVYENPEENDYHSINVGKNAVMYYIYSKEDLTNKKISYKVKGFLWGLHELHKPATLIYPRPYNFTDDMMNATLKEKSPEEVYNFVTHWYNNIRPNLIK